MRPDHERKGSLVEKAEQQLKRLRERVNNRAELIVKIAFDAAAPEQVSP
jgi:hypothetical protein